MTQLSIRLLYTSAALLTGLWRRQAGLSQARGGLFRSHAQHVQ